MQKKFAYNDLSSESSEVDQMIGETEEKENVSEHPDEMYEVNDHEILNKLETDDVNEEDYKTNFVPDMNNLNNLQPAKHAYDVLSQFQLDWPMLSIDYVCTNSTYQQQPFDFFFVGGTTTSGLEKPQIQIIKISNVSKDAEASDSSDAELSQQDIVEPTIERRVFDVDANVLRVKSHTKYYNNQFQCGNPNIGAAWLENSKLVFYSLNNQFKSLNSLMPNELPATNFLQQQNCYDGCVKQLSFQEFQFTKPGYALDTHPLLNLTVCGNNDNVINAFKINQSGQVFQDKSNLSSFISGSVEDIRFANCGEFMQSGVFAAASTCGCVQLIDPRSQELQKPFKISNCDINVLDFDYQCQFTIYVGDDAGQVSQLDLRNTSQVVKQLNYNKAAITSLKSSPTSPGTICVADDNGAVIFYQIDQENDAELIKLNLPSEYLFLHCGQEEPREVTFCGQVDGYVATTDLNGLQLIKPQNI